MSDLDRYRMEQMKDPEFKEYHEEMHAAAELSKALVGIRTELGLTQKELAKLTGLTQSDISRLESCDANPSLKMLNRIARGLNMQLNIQFVASESTPTDRQV